MSSVDIELSVPVVRTGRTAQVEGMFDVPRTEISTVSYHFDAPFEEREWNVGLIVGPSGAGKTQVARHLFGDCIVDGYDWPSGAVVDGFDEELSIRDVTGALSKVGFSSPPAWLKPFHVLSNGQKFRANLARSLVDPRPLVVVDEFTSVVDRTVAQIGSHAVAKAVRKAGRKFVAVSCHDDIIDWLQPDWTLEPHVGEFHWRSVQRRPDVEVEIFRAEHSAWPWFAEHHYLSAKLMKGTRNFVGLIQGRPACFAALRHFPHPAVKPGTIWAVSRVVALPDFQGIGLVARGFLDAIGGVCRTLGKRMRTHPAHPALIHAWAKSPRWKLCEAPNLRASAGKTGVLTPVTDRRRVASFEYVGPKHPNRREALRLWA